MIQSAGEWLRRQEASERQLVWLERIMVLSAMSSIMFVGVVFGLRLGYVELFAPYNAVGVGFPERFADYWRFANAAAMLSFVVLTMAGISMWTSEQIN